MPLKRSALAIIALVITTATAAASAAAGTLDLNINLASVHTQRWAQQSLNQRNPGLGATYHVSRTWSVAGGVYRNSYRRSSVYALGEWTPLQLGYADKWHADAGVAAGIASGYKRGEVPCAPFAAVATLRVVAPSGIGLNLVGVPNSGRGESGFVGFQLLVPLP